VAALSQSRRLMTQADKIASEYKYYGQALMRDMNRRQHDHQRLREELNSLKLGIDEVDSDLDLCSADASQYIGLAKREAVHVVTERDNTRKRTTKRLALLR
jgi:hypothetical protein